MDVSLVGHGVPRVSLEVCQERRRHHLGRRSTSGEKRAIDSVKVYPANDRFVPGQGFPIRFKIEASSEPEFHKPIAIVSHLDADVPNPKGAIQQYSARGVECRYVRLTATRLPKIEPNSGLHG